MLYKVRSPRNPGDLSHLSNQPDQPWFLSRLCAASRTLILSSLNPTINDQGRRRGWLRMGITSFPPIDDASVLSSHPLSAPLFCQAYHPPSGTPASFCDSGDSARESFCLLKHQSIPRKQRKLSSPIIPERSYISQFLAGANAPHAASL